MLPRQVLERFFAGGDYGGLPICDSMILQPRCIRKIARCSAYSGR